LNSPDPRWEAFAAREPHFAVLTESRFLRANLTPEREREFFASGEAVASWMLAVIDAGLAPQFAPMSTLEYGCGLGRLALPLAQRPGSVTAVDRSPVMLELARREAAGRGLAHIAFETPAELFAAPRLFDLVVCYHVLQRLRPVDAMALVRRLIGLVGPGGVAVLQWPYRTSVPGIVAASRWLRERLPGANALANTIRGKPAADPFIPTHLYDLSEMLLAFDFPEFRSTHLALQHHEGLDYAIVFAQKDERTDAARVRSRPHQAYDGPAVAGRDAVSDAEIDAFNRAADQYFTSLADWEHHLAKPFSQIEETPTLLMSVAVLLQALRLTPGMTVLEFGAGSGWLSRYLTQMGCRVVLLDVSPEALRIARELYARQPVLGDQPAPEFLEFDGRRIALPDGSVDRIVCFDAFHHAPNPHAVIREFARILADGGIAGFAEPGPRHAEAPRSQFESHTYGVVERDVDVHDLWRTAKGSGFSDLRMCVFHGPPHHVSLQEYEDLVTGGPAQEAWLGSTRKFLRHVRSFCLVKAGTGRADSRTVAGLACDVRASVAIAAGVEGRIVLDAIVTNTGAATWLASDAPRGGVALGTHLYDGSGGLVSFDFHCEPLTDPPREIGPGETVRRRVTLPPIAPGRYRLELDCVAAHVTWFAQAGSRPAALTVEVPELDENGPRVHHEGH
jgi:2-polyprenyl-3-methyl-5-hydroxy-6-metoxy-1,4-benzoquinol methylase